MSHASADYVGSFSGQLIDFALLASLALLATAVIDASRIAPAGRVLVWKACFVGVTALLVLCGATGERFVPGLVVKNSLQFPTVCVWLAGTAFCAGASVVLLLRKYLVVRSSRRVAHLPTAHQWKRAAKIVGLGRSEELRSSDKANSAVAWGLGRPFLIVPRGILRLDRPDLDVLLLAEALRINERDWLGLVVTRFATAVLWFHPLAWCGGIALRRALVTSIDEKVIAKGVEPFHYADLLYRLHRPPVCRAHGWPLRTWIEAALDRRMMAVLHRKRASARRTPAARVRIATAAAIVVFAALALGSLAPGRTRRDLKVALLGSQTNQPARWAKRDQQRPVGRFIPEQQFEAGRSRSADACPARRAVIDPAYRVSDASPGQFTLLKTRQTMAHGKAAQMAFVKAIAESRPAQNPGAADQASLRSAETDHRALSLDLGLCLSEK